MPSDDDLRIRLEQRRLVEPLERLLRNRFEGRTRELERLRLHVGVLPATSWRGKIAQYGRAKSEQGTADDRPRMPLVVYGPGGIGKSTLIARFLLDHVTALKSDFPFVYVDFERATISIHEPMSMVGEMARQLAALYPRHAERFTALAARCRTIARQRSEEQEETDEWQAIATTRTLGREVQHRIYVNARDDDAQMAAELGMVTRIAAKWTPDAHRPFLIVLDSFEEAQYRASPILDRLWALLGALSSTYPDTRVVVAGRAPVGHPEVDVADIPTIELGELDRGAALQFLTTRGVAQPVASALVDRVGGSPLSLHLAAAAAHRTGDADGSGDWVDTVPARRRRLFGSVDDMLIQGVLYDRLLHHITNSEVRRLAHPGLVLRRLTPQIIMTVLAPHCGVVVPDLERARELFTEMARELDLVDHVAPEVLQHRPDVRRIMLQLLEKDKTSATRAIERSAVDYYAAVDNPTDRAEEIYHRLRLGDDLRAVKERWIPAAAPDTLSTSTASCRLAVPGCSTGCARTSPTTSSSSRTRSTGSSDIRRGREPAGTGVRRPCTRDAEGATAVDHVQPAARAACRRPDPQRPGDRGAADVTDALDNEVWSGVATPTSSCCWSRPRPRRRSVTSKQPTPTYAGLSASRPASAETSTRSG